MSGQNIIDIGEYEVNLFGPNAEELAGRVYNYDEDYDELDHIGFSGKR